MKRKKWFLSLTAVGLCIIFFAMYFIFGNPLHYKVIEKDTSNYLHTIKNYKQEEIQSITGKYTPIYNIGYYAEVVYKDEPYFTYSYTYDNNNKIIQDNGILGRHTESFEHLNLNWSLFDQLIRGIHTNLQERGLSEKRIILYEAFNSLISMMIKTVQKHMLTLRKIQNQIIHTV